MNSDSPRPTTIDAYIASYPIRVRERLEQMHRTIRAADAEETIKYAMPPLTLNGDNLVHFAAFKHHIGFYSVPTGIAAFKAELGGYKSAKGSIQFPLEQPIPLDLVRRIVEFRVQENLRQAKPRRKR
jgi:uncharacterized protein YdhG (YjbR/CyaY superfamily)